MIENPLFLFVAFTYVTLLLEIEFDTRYPNEKRKEKRRGGGGSILCVFHQQHFLILCLSNIMMNLLTNL